MRNRNITNKVYFDEEISDNEGVWGDQFAPARERFGNRVLGVGGSKFELVQYYAEEIKKIKPFA